MKINIKDWNVEDEGYWASKGSRIATRNILISIPSLLLAFSVWIMWGIIITKMKEFGYNFGMLEGVAESLKAAKLKEINSLYYTLPAIAGLAGATLRIPNSFLIGLAGGRNVIFITTALLLIPAIGVGFALQDVNTSYMTFAILALLSGFGGGNFASSMSNISYFFPKRVQGTSLGFNAGIGNLGVGVMQKTIPWVIGIFLFSAIDKDGTIVSGEALAGIQNAGWVWVPVLLICTVAAFFGMNNVVTGTPKMPNAIKGISTTLYMNLLGLIAAGIGAYLLVSAGINMWIVLPIVVVVAVMLMKFATPGEMKENLTKQFAIFKDKQNWVMTVIYTMTFGSFIGFSAAFPKLCQDIFVYTSSTDPTYINPNAPNFLMWVFLGPVIGALIRPFGGWLSDKINSGSRVTAISTVFQTAAALAVAYFIKEAKGSATPEDYWWPFFACFMLLFATTGIGNGSTFRSIPYIFSKEQAGPVLGWTSAIAAYGAFIIPKVFGAQIKAGTPEFALYGFAIYYTVCLGLNWYFYDRKKGIKC
ncbi:MAG: NarK/NasA family nitrate transporter [Bacteroidales bacterium]|nr:NarK/NasA family nitrate transporter [Bacteroidota bacterium]MBL6949175.1 NarK/NasA family nitrate transporter [Bacteroidales bacterium]